MRIIIGKKWVKRDQKGRKMTQKGATHSKGEPKQPQRSMMTNHERHQMRRMQRSAK